MSWRMLVKTLRKTLTSQFTRINENKSVRKTKQLFVKSNKMEPPKKKQKFVPEECELMIEINKKGQCRFDIISKVESVCNDKSRNVINDNERLGTQSESTDISESEDIDNDIPADEVDSAKNICDIGACIPPTSKYVALDCEFVGVLADISALGRCSIVNYDGDIICDIYAQPVEKITHYRTRWSGITKKDMKKAIPLESALSQISDIIQDKIVVGHGIHNDFRVLGFGHPRHMIRDTQKCMFLRDQMQLDYDTNQSMSLKKMAHRLLGETIQTGGHCSVIDARATMELYKLVREKWETSLLNEGRGPNHPGDPDQSSNHTDETVGTTKKENNGLVRKESKHSNTADHIVSLTGIQNGKISKKRKRSKKKNGVKHHFGQIIAGNKKLNDYFKDETVLKKGKTKFSEFLKNGFCKGKTSEGDSSNTDSDGVIASTSGISIEICNPMSLRDGTTYQTASTDRKVSLNESKKELLKMKTSEKITLKSSYAENIQQLFHDDFWNDMNVPADLDTELM